MARGVKSNTREGAGKPTTPLPHLTPDRKYLVSAADAGLLCSMSTGRFVKLSRTGEAPQPVGHAEPVPLWRTAEIKAWANAGMPDCREWKWTGGAA